MKKTRNPHACAPIMRKGGVHQRSQSGVRARLNRQLEDAIVEYLAEQDDGTVMIRPGRKSAGPDSLILSPTT